MPFLTLANALTATRLGLIGPLAWLCVTGHWVLALAVFWTCVLTDVFDGKLARARAQVTAFGGIFDHATDATLVAVVLVVFSAGAVVAVPLLLPILTTLAFVQYALDSKILAGAPLRASGLGRFNGVAYFVFAGTLIHFGAIDTWLSVAPAHAATTYAILAVDLVVSYLLPVAAWLLVLSTLVSMGDRLLTWRRLRRRAQ